MLRMNLRKLRNMGCTGSLVPSLGRCWILDFVEKVEDTLRLAIAVTKLRESGSREHRRRIRLAKQIVDLANAVIAKEVREAVNRPVGDKARMSWREIADLMGVSPSTAFNRYGVKRNDEQHRAN